MNKNILLLALCTLLTAGFVASCDDDDEPSVASQVSGTYIGYSIASSSLGHFQDLPSEPDTLIIGAVSDTQVNIIYKSSLWGYADYKNIDVTQAGGKYVFSAVHGTHTFGRPGRPDTYSEYDSEMASSTMSADHQTLEFTFSTTPIAQSGTYTIVFHNGSLAELK